MSNTTTTKAYSALLAYVKRNNINSRFDGNTLRERIAVPGLKPSQFGGVVNKAIRNGIIVKIGETISNNPKHNSGKVGVYVRSLRSYVR